MKTVLCPYDLTNNISFKIKRRYIKENGFDIIKLSQAMKNNFRGCKIANLNFYESLYSDKVIVCLFRYFIKSIVLNWMCIRNVKIVFTMHNKIGHDSKCAKLERKLMKKLCFKSSAIVVLCDESRLIINRIVGGEKKEVVDKIVKIPLISYEGFYLKQGIDVRKKYEIPSNVMVFAFMGGIRRYKNIEMIIDAAQSMAGKECVFIIAGAGDQEYIGELKKKAQGITSIKIIDRFIPDEEMADFAEGVDVFVFPYNKRSSLNSGSCMYAFSHAKNCICPKIGTIKELKQDVTYSYDYSSAEQHAVVLREKCEAAYDEWKNKRALFDEKRRSLYEETKINNSYQRISMLYGNLYRKLIKR